jgi:integrase
MYLMAAMTGMRQGELLALRWQDIDWLAGSSRAHPSKLRPRRVRHAEVQALHPECPAG